MNSNDSNYLFKIGNTVKHKSNNNVIWVISRMPGEMDRKYECNTVRGTNHTDVVVLTQYFSEQELIGYRTKEEQEEWIKYLNTITNG